MTHKVSLMNYSYSPQRFKKRGHGSRSLLVAGVQWILQPGLWNVLAFWGPVDTSRKQAFKNSSPNLLPMFLLVQSPNFADDIHMSGRKNRYSNWILNLLNILKSLAFLTIFVEPFLFGSLLIRWFCGWNFWGLPAAGRWGHWASSREPTWLAGYSKYMGIRVISTVGI